MRSLKAAGLVLLVASPISTVSVATPTTIFTLPGPVAPASWFENLAVRPNGLILATRGDAPEIWQIDPATGVGSLLVSVAGAFNLTGIAEVVSHRRPQGVQSNCDEETYVFGSSHIPAPLQVEPGSAKVWKLRLGAGAAPAVSLLAAMPQAGFINGVAAWGPGRVLLSDTEREAAYLMDADTGSYTTPLTNLIGVNGIQTAPGYVYRADHATQTLSRIPVHKKDASPRGPAEILAANQSIDDFAIAVGKSSQGKAYIAAMYDNAVVEVTFGPAPSSGPGTKRVVAENLSGTGVGLVTVVAFGRRAQDAGLLYATVGQGGGSASIVVLDPSQ